MGEINPKEILLNIAEDTSNSAEDRIRAIQTWHGIEREDLFYATATDKSGEEFSSEVIQELRNELSEVKELVDRIIDALP